MEKCRILQEDLYKLQFEIPESPGILGKILRFLIRFLQIRKPINKIPNRVGPLGAARPAVVDGESLRLLH